MWLIVAVNKYYFSSKIEKIPISFRCSSAVERLAVNEKVAGSNPATGALIEIEQEIARFLFYSLAF